MTDTSPVLAVLPSRCPSRRIGLELPLATIEELDLLAARNHISRGQILRQIIDEALLSDAPHWAEGQDAIGRLAEHAYLTHVRSHELAAACKSRATWTAQSVESDRGSSCG
jgi:Ribbon-helix-helix protein, copG family